MPVRLSIHPSVGPSVHLYVTSSVEKKIITLRPVAFRFQYSFCRSRIGFDRQKILSQCGRCGTISKITKYIWVRTPNFFCQFFLPKLFQNSKNDFRCASLFSELIPQHRYIFLYAILFFVMHALSKKKRKIFTNSSLGSKSYAIPIFTLNGFEFLIMLWCAFMNILFLLQFLHWPKCQSLKLLFL